MTLDSFLRAVGSGHGLFVALGVSFLAGIVACAVCPLPAASALAPSSTSLPARGAAASGAVRQSRRRRENLAMTKSAV